MLGRPKSTGFAENETAWQPICETRRTSSAHELRVPERQDRERDEAARIGAGPLVDVPVVVRAQPRASDSSLSAVCTKSLPAKDGNDGKHIDASTPLAFMSPTRA